MEMRHVSQLSPIRTDTAISCERSWELRPNRRRAVVEINNLIVDQTSTDATWPLNLNWKSDEDMAGRRQKFGWFQEISLYNAKQHKHMWSTIPNDYVDKQPCFLHSRPKHQLYLLVKRLLVIFPLCHSNRPTPAKLENSRCALGQQVGCSTGW